VVCAIGYGALDLQSPATQSTPSVVPALTTMPSSAVTRSQQQPHAGAPPQLASNESKRDFSDVLSPSAWTLQQPTQCSATKQSLFCVQPFAKT
jgi:hypothetical protein